MKTKLFLNNGAEVMVINEFKYGDKDYCVYYETRGWSGDLFLREKGYLLKEEDTQAYKMRAELEKIKVERDNEIKKIQNEAVESLVFRLKLNSILGKSKDGALGIMIAEELEKLILK